jgi:putative DNA primase/helicase
MRAVEFARNFNRVARRGDWYDAQCPAHDDRRPSLSFKDGDRGLIVKCHAGCSLEQIVSHLGLSVRDLFNNSLRPVGRSRIVTTYPYRDENSELLYEVVRFEPKSFAMRRPDGAGGWVWNMAGVRRVLYRLPELRGQDTVFIPEGEKDADNLVALGLVATTSPWGAGSWRQEYAEQLVEAGAVRVIVLPDNDEAGETYAEAAARSCRRAGLVVEVLQLPDLPHGGDVSEWLTKGGTLDKLLALRRKPSTTSTLEADVGRT